ncbi:Protein lin-7-like protein B [Aphelenchoides avenae]|nr:Protein lin-7-like protein B [Aphelenchus avenae]
MHWFMQNEHIQDYLFCGTCIAKKHKGHDYHEVDVHTQKDTAATEVDAWVLAEEGSVAKAAVEAFASAEDGVLPRVVELSTTDVFGFASRGGKEVDFPIFVSGILPGGVAEHNGGLRRGDQLIAINGINVEHVSHETAVRLLKSAMGNLKLLVRYRPNLLDELFDWIERHLEGQ